MPVLFSRPKTGGLAVIVALCFTAPAMAQSTCTDQADPTCVTGKGNLSVPAPHSFGQRSPSKDGKLGGQGTSISGTDLGSGRISSGDLGSGRIKN